MNGNADGPKRSESDVYDRQIRLWGADAQSKISSAHILFIHVTGVSSEILKNLVLAGVRATICDGRPYPSAVADLPSFFLLAKDRNTADGSPPTTVASAMKPRVEELNPLLEECGVEECAVEALTEEKVSQFPIVVASRIGFDQASRLADITAKAGGKFYLVDCFGWHGCATVDLGPKHTFRKEMGKKLSDWITLDKYVPLGTIAEVPLADLTNRFHKIPPKIWSIYRAYQNYYAATGNWPDASNANDFCVKTQEWIAKEAREGVLRKDYLGGDEEVKHLATLAKAEVPPVSAVLGGVIGNEIIKAISGKGEAAQNIIMFDGMSGSCQDFFVNRKS